MQNLPFQSLAITSSQPVSPISSCILALNTTLALGRSQDPFCVSSSPICIPFQTSTTSEQAIFVPAIVAFSKLP